MLRHFSKIQAQPPPAQEDNEAAEQEFGGIWVGGNEDYPVGEEANEQQNQEQLPGPGLPNQDTSGHNIEAVTKALRWHASLSLVDVSMLLLAPLICTGWGNLVVHSGQLFYCFWVPFLVIKNSFSQLDGFWSYIWRKLPLAN